MCQLCRHLELLPRLERRFRIDGQPVGVAFVAQRDDLGLDAVLHRQDRTHALFRLVCPRHENGGHRQGLDFTTRQAEVVDALQAVDTADLGVVAASHGEQLPLLAVAVVGGQPLQVGRTDRDDGGTLALGDQHCGDLLRLGILLHLDEAALAVGCGAGEVHHLQVQVELLGQHVSRVEAAAPGVNRLALQVAEVVQDDALAADLADPRDADAAGFHGLVERQDLQVFVVQPRDGDHVVEPLLVTVAHVQREVELEDAGGCRRIRPEDLGVVVQRTAGFEHLDLVLEAAVRHHVVDHGVVVAGRRARADDHRLVDGSRRRHRGGDEGQVQGVTDQFHEISPWGFT